jgi:hypothetical protein
MLTLTITFEMLYYKEMSQQSVQDYRPIEYIGDLDEVVNLKPRNMRRDW